MSEPHWTHQLYSFKWNPFVDLEFGTSWYMVQALSLGEHTPAPRCVAIYKWQGTSTCHQLWPKPLKVAFCSKRFNHRCDPMDPVIFHSLVMRYQALECKKKLDDDFLTFSSAGEVAASTHLAAHFRPSPGSSSSRFSISKSFCQLTGANCGLTRALGYFDMWIPNRSKAGRKKRKISPAMYALNSKKNTSRKWNDLTSPK